MKLIFLSICSLFLFSACGQSPTKNLPTMKYNDLNEEEKRVILNKGTERAFTGLYFDSKETGVYTCRQCNLPLFKSTDKFNSGTGWPSFDDQISDHVTQIKDADGMRVEIVCTRCKGHLGHVFKGEKFTKKETRHCVNSISMDFVPQSEMDTAIFASGCFWGTEYYMERMEGVLFTTVGYIGGKKENPSYKEVCTGNTGHAEAVRVIYDRRKTNYEALAKLFFETHDPSQVNRQGPDIGTQYRSEIFYLDEKQKQTAQSLIQYLNTKGVSVATKVTLATEFWPAENYHQQYYTHKGSTPYCHRFEKKF